MGLLRMAARTAVVAGTATAVSGRVSRRQANRYAQKEQAQADDEQQSAPEDHAPAEQETAAPAPLAPTGDASVGDQLQQLATLRDQGVLSDEEFTAAKSKLLGI
jgi:transcription initiation factor TFIID subunit TAF12